jgi:peptidyl-prolyl cis-trans isomerase D
MISWIQRTFQQHFKWLFLILLAVVIVSFVFITNASSGLGSGGQPKIPDRPYFGINLSKVEDSRPLIEDAQLSLFLQRPANQPEPSPSEVEQYALQRHLALYLADQLGLTAPAPDSPEVAAHIQTLGHFTGPDGRFDPKAYSAFIDSLKINPRLTEGDIARVILDDIRAQAYQKLLAGPGYVLASDLAEQLGRRDTRWTLALATLDGATFNPGIEVSDTALQTWFESNSRRYEISARVSVASVRIPAAKFAASVNFTDDEIRAAYDANPAKYPVTAPLAADASADLKFASVRAAVEAGLKQEAATKSALSAIDDLAVHLLEKRIAPDKLADYLATQNLTAEELGPIASDSIPASLGGLAASTKILPEIVRLAADRPYSNPVATPEGAALLVWRDTIPARVPALAEVRDRAASDYRDAEKRRLFNEAGRQLRATVAAALTTGQPFASALTTAATAAGIKSEIKTPDSFTLAQPPSDFDYSAYQALATLEQGKVSELIPTSDSSALLVHAVKKEIPAFDPAAPEVAQIKTQMAGALSSRNAQGLLGESIETELAKSAPATE